MPIDILGLIWACSSHSFDLHVAVLCHPAGALRQNSKQWLRARILEALDHQLTMKKQNNL
jgi:hypothetical protein